MRPTLGRMRLSLRRPFCFERPPNGLQRDIVIGADAYFNTRSERLAVLAVHQLPAIYQC
jgi:hypothetical protein